MPHQPRAVPRPLSRPVRVVTPGRTAAAVRSRAARTILPIAFNLSNSAPDLIDTAHLHAPPSLAYLDDQDAIGAAQHQVRNAIAIDHDRSGLDLPHPLADG